MDKTDPYLRMVYSSAASDDSEEPESSLGGMLKCQVCKKTVGTIDSELVKESVVSALEDFGILICDQTQSANATVCPGAVTEMGDIIVPVLTNFLLSPE